MEPVVIEKEVMKLSSIDKALLADRLLQSLDSEHEANIKAWGRVAEKRLDEYRSGKMDAYDGQTVIETLRKQIS